MKLDSEHQREILVNCIQNANVNGSVLELMPLLTEVVGVLEIVKSAEIEAGEETACLRNSTSVSQMEAASER
jgi:hypothetical protein